MSADSSVSNLKFLGTDFGLNRIFGPKHGEATSTVATRWLGLTMPGMGADDTHLNRRTAVIEREPAAQIAAAPAAIPAEVQAATATAEAITPADQDRALVSAILGGDQSAFSELVTRYQTAVFNMAYRMLGDPTEAEDAAQEVFVRAWKQLRTFQLERRFSTWLLSIASHHCIDLLRRRKPQAPLDGVALYIPSSDPEPDEVVLRAEQREMVRGLIESLPDKYRAVTLLRYYGDMSYDEIARTSGLSESAVKTQLHRARRMLADRLLAQGGPDGNPNRVAVSINDEQRG